MHNLRSSKLVIVAIHIQCRRRSSFGLQFRFLARLGPFRQTSIAMPRLGPQVSCQTIAEKLRELKQKEFDIKHALLRCSQDKTAKLRRYRRLEEVALSVLWQSNGSRTLMQEFLARNLGEQDLQTVADACDAVLAKFKAMSAKDTNLLRESTTPGKSTAPARTATRFLKEFRLAKWVETRNMEQSIAPVVSLVAQEARATNCLPPEADSTKHKCQLQWLRRWRKRWNITLGSIPAREHVPPEEARRKASGKQQVCAGVLIRFGFRLLFSQRTNREWVPLFGPCFGPAISFLNKLEVHIPAPVFKFSEQICSFSGNSGVAMVQLSACSRSAN